MEAKDTVVNHFATADEQAEISFKAGRKEVVEWINKHYPIGTPKWQSQLEEWGIFVDH